MVQAEFGGIKYSDPIRDTVEFQNRRRDFYDNNQKYRALKTREGELLRDIYADQDLNKLANKNLKVNKVTHKLNKKTGKEIRYYYGSNGNILAMSLFEKRSESRDEKIPRGRRKMIIFADGCSKIGHILDSENFSFEEGSEFYNLHLDKKTCQFFGQDNVAKIAQKTQGWRHQRAIRCTNAEGFFNSENNSCGCETTYNGGEPFLVPHYDYNFQNCSGKRINHKDEYAQIRKLASVAGVEEDNYPEISNTVFSKAKKLCDKYNKANQFFVEESSSASGGSQPAPAGPESSTSAE